MASKFVSARLCRSILARARRRAALVAVLALAACGGPSSGGDKSAGATGAAGAPPAARPIDGRGANPAHPDWGARRTPLLRAAPAAYSDGDSALARADGASPRVVSNAVLRPGVARVGADPGLTDWFWAFGQFVDHDIGLTPEQEEDDFQPAILRYVDLANDDRQSHDVVAERANIPIPADDPLHGIGADRGPQSMTFLRAQYLRGSHPREQVNVVTAWLDGSMIYGSDEEDHDEVRSHFEGLLNEPTRAGGLPRNARADREGFIAGDVRVGENVALASLHAVFVREHNRLARLIHAADGSLSDDAVFQAARRLVIAEIQKIAFNDWLPIVLGAPLPAWTGWKADVNPQLRTEFSTCAFRFCHTMLPDSVQRLDAQGEEMGPADSGGGPFGKERLAAGPLPLRFAFGAHRRMAGAGGYEAILRGLSKGRARPFDATLAEQVRDHLDTGKIEAQDIGAVNIQRGRDNGVPDYATVRAAYGLPRPQSFADITDDPALAAALASVYPSVDVIDPWVGMLAEAPQDGALVGPTMATIIREQMIRIRDADPYWWEGALDPETRAWIASVELGDVVNWNYPVDAPRAPFRVDAAQDPNAPPPRPPGW